MDTSDPLITFDDAGNCNHCNSALEAAGKIWFPDERGEIKLRDIIDRIRLDGQKKEYDCIIGLSGGVDSSYLAYLAVRHGLKPLIVHVDCGWNSELAVKNVENIVKKLNLELHTFVVDWEEMKDLQRAFFKASLPDQDIPQDHAIFSALCRFARDNNIKYVISGQNFATESINPEAWGHQAMDYRHLKAIHAKFGEHKLSHYPHVNFFQRYIYYTLMRGMKFITPLNYLDYRKEEIISILEKELDWKYYGGKHYESRFTKFFQSYYLPVKFNFDKRRSHLSSLIISGQITREEALEIVKEKPYDEKEISGDLEYVAKKLDWTVAEFKTIINKESKRHKDFPTNDRLFKLGLNIRNKVSLMSPIK